MSGEKLISIAEKENKTNIRSVCDSLFGMMDLLSLILIVLPLYPHAVDGYVYSVNLFSYTQTTVLNRTVYWALFFALVAIGAVKILLTQLQAGKDQKVVTIVSIAMSIVLVIYLALAGETYAVTVAFLLLLIKAMLLFRQIKVSH